MNIERKRTVSKAPSFGREDSTPKGRRRSFCYFASLLFCADDRERQKELWTIEKRKLYFGMKSSLENLRQANRGIIFERIKKRGESLTESPSN